MCIQDIIITVLTFYYGGSTIAALVFSPIYIGINYVLCTPAITPFAVILKLQEFNLIVLLISRVSFGLFNYLLFLSSKSLLLSCYTVVFTARIFTI